jgi:ADP-dependent NAD(P)H-hydrate dehydratase
MTQRIDAAWCADHPLPTLGAGLDKDARGQVLIFGGSTLIPGATRLTGEAALRVGAGKVQIGTVDAAATVIGVAFPEAAVIGLRAGSDGTIDPNGLAPIERLLKSADVLVIGPGMHGCETGPQLLRGLLDRVGEESCILLDAGMLEALKSVPDALKRRGRACVLTPHHGELARLMDVEEGEVANHAERFAREAAARFGAIVALKSSTTVIADPGGGALTYSSEAPGLGTAGSGDVLAGVIAGLLSRKIDGLDAVGWGVRLHGEAGRAAGQAIGAIGYLARDLLTFLPRLVSAPA